MRKLILGLALALTPTLAQAATMLVEQHDGKTRLVIEGDINAGDGDRFLARAAVVRPAHLEMNSPGGDLESGMVIARWVHENRPIKVFVEDYCNSACSFAALVALGRGDLTINASSSVGVHQAVDVVDDRPGKANLGVTRQAADMLRVYGAPEEPLLAMVATPPRDITAFDAAALENMGATVAQATLPELPIPTNSQVPDLPAAPEVAAPKGIAAVGLLLLFLSGLMLASRRMAPAKSKERPMNFNRQMRRDLERGYEVNYTTLKVAYAIEIGIILAAFYASYEFANRYVSDQWTLWIMAIIGGAAVALAESARIFLAKNVRTQTSFGWKALSALGLICMCIVTTKAMSQVMEQTYSPRLRQVQQATDTLKLAEAALNPIVTNRDAAVNKLQQLEKDVNDAEANIQRVNDLIAQQGAAPADRIVKVAVKSTCRNKRGKKYSCTKTVNKYEKVEWAGQQFAEQLPAATDKRAEAVAKRDAQQATVLDLEQQKAAKEAVVGEAEAAERGAVGNSQLHSFTAMVFGKDPIDVTDAEIHWFLRLFILIPAIMIAVASSILAMVSYTRVGPRQVELKITDEANTLTNHIGRAVDRRVEERMAAAAQRKRKPKSSVVEPEQALQPTLRAVNSNV